jgi:hypothetical protein
MVFCEMCACFSYFVIICCSSRALMHSSWWSFVLNPIMGTWSIPACTGFEYMVFFLPNDLAHSHFILTPCIKILNPACTGDLLQPDGNSVLRMIWSSLWLDKILETKIFTFLIFKIVSGLFHCVLYCAHIKMTLPFLWLVHLA